MPEGPGPIGEPPNLVTTASYLWPAKQWVPTKYLGMRKGGRHWNARLTEEKVRAIRALHGVCPNKIIAREFGTTEKNIWAVVARKSWAWLDAEPHA